MTTMNDIGSWDTGWDELELTNVQTFNSTSPSPTLVPVEVKYLPTVRYTPTVKPPARSWFSREAVSLLQTAIVAAATVAITAVLAGSGTILGCTAIFAATMVA